MNVSYEALKIIMTSLSPERRASIQSITEAMVKLKLNHATMDAILASIILEAAEVQFVEDGGAIPPVRESTLDVLRPIFESKKDKIKKN